MRRHANALLIGCAVGLLAFGWAVAPALGDDSLADTSAADSLYEPVAPPAATPAAATPAPAAASTPNAGASPLPAVAPSPAAARDKSATVMVPAGMPEPPYVKRGDAIPATTTEIPRTVQDQNDNSEDSGPPAVAQNPPAVTSGRQVVNYQPPGSPLVDPDPEVHSLQEFMDDGDNMSPLGIEVQETRWKIGSGKMADGLLIVGVTPGSAAARAGLHSFKRGPKELLEGVIIAGAMFFPPAAIAVPVVDSLKVGESADLIIAVDGFRVINFLDFEERMRDVQPGEIVYFTIVRDGVRMQMPVQVPANLPAPIF